MGKYCMHLVTDWSGYISVDWSPDSNRIVTYGSQSSMHNLALVEDKKLNFKSWPCLPNLLMKKKNTSRGIFHLRFFLCRTRLLCTQLPDRQLSSGE